MFVYTFTQSQARPESFIPFIGPLVGGADARSQAVILRFTPDGHLVESSRTNTQVGVGTGIISGSMPQAKPATP